MRPIHLVPALLCALLAGPLFAAPPLVLTDGQDQYAMGLHLDLLPDPQSQYTIQDISDPAFADRFAPSQQLIPIYGFELPVLWVRFTLKNETAQTRNWTVENQHKMDIEIYIPNGDQGWTVKRAGQQQPFATREVKHRHETFRLSVEPGQSRTFYMRSSVNPGIMGAFLVLRTEAAFAIHDHDEQIILGIYYGIIAVMVFYNLFVFFSLRDRAYLSYVIMTLSIGFWFAWYNVVAKEYFWPDSSQEFWPGWRINVLVGFWNWVWILDFVRRFLHTRENAPRIHRLLSALMIFNVLLLAGVLLDQYRAFAPFVNLFWLLEWILVLVTTIVVWRQDFRPARYLLIAWATMIGGVILNLFFWMGIVPGNFLTLNSFQIGHALEAILLSLALADRINILREEKAREEETSRQAELRAHTAELQAQAVEKELQTAQELQMGLMPTTSPQIQDFDIAGRCLPASRIGGDFFQYFQQNGTLSICIADVTGHAMEAAVPVMMFSGVLETEMQYGHPIERLLTQLNHLLYHKLDRRTFVCFTIGEIDLSSRKVRLANGGCPYPFHYRAATGQVTELFVEAYPLGARQETSYPVIEVQLAPGDRLVFCSDGLVEAQNGQEEMFGFEPLAETIRQGCAEGLSAGDLINRLIGAVKNFAGTAPQGDDMTCVVLSVGK